MYAERLRFQGKGLAPALEPRCRSWRFPQSYIYRTRVRQGVPEIPVARLVGRPGRESPQEVPMLAFDGLADVFTREGRTTRVAIFAANMARWLGL